MPDCDQPRDAIERRPEVIAVALVRVSGVERDADAKSADRGEIFGRERTLRA